MLNLGIAALAWSLLALGGAPPAADPLAAYYGNTFISHHGDGVEYRVFYNRDRTFELFRAGGPDPAASFDVHGTYTVDPNGKVCFTFKDPAPKFPPCVTQDTTRRVGEAWDFPFNGTVERHSLVPGQVRP